MRGRDSHRSGGGTASARWVTVSASGSSAGGHGASSSIGPRWGHDGSCQGTGQVVTVIVLQVIAVFDVEGDHTVRDRLGTSSFSATQPPPPPRTDSEGSREAGHCETGDNLKAASLKRSAPASPPMAPPQVHWHTRYIPQWGTQDDWFSSPKLLDRGAEKGSSSCARHREGTVALAAAVTHTGLRALRLKLRVQQTLPRRAAGVPVPRAQQRPHALRQAPHLPSNDSPLARGVAETDSDAI